MGRPLPRQGLASVPQDGRMPPVTVAMAFVARTLGYLEATKDRYAEQCRPDAGDRLVAGILETLPPNANDL